jgi:hypothetical protein
MEALKDMSMTIAIEDVAAGRVEFGDVVDPDQAGRLPPLHPGEVLREEFLDPLRMSAYALAKALCVPSTGSPESWPASAPSAPTPRFDWAGFSARHQNSGSTCRAPTTSSWHGSNTAVRSLPRSSLLRERRQKPGSKHRKPGQGVRVRYFSIE